jgi:hypothetical protein
LPSVHDLRPPPTLAPLARLPQEFRDNAAAARRLAGSDAAAHVWEMAATEVEDRLGEALLEPLALDLASLESGYTRSHLLRLIRDSTIPNSGTQNDPRILRMHLPRKPGLGVDGETMRPASSRVQAARAVIEGEE